MRKYVDLVVISNIGRGRNFGDIFTKSQKLVYIKYLTLINIGLVTKVNCLKFNVFILDVKCI